MLPQVISVPSVSAILYILVGLILAIQPLLVYLLTQARIDRREQTYILDAIKQHLSTLNGSVAKHQVWIEQHEKWAEEQREELSRGIKDIEERERQGITKPPRRRK